MADIVLFQLGDTLVLECKSDSLEECYAQPPRKPVVTRVESFKNTLAAERENECIKDSI